MTEAMSLDDFPKGPDAPDYSEFAGQDRVKTRMYEDPALFDAEMEKIFGKTWVWVAHASEVPDKGSFKLSTVGTQPVIVSRDRKSNVHVMVNRCRHRAATVCEVKQGKTSSFQCPYHGWGYALEGSLRAIPYTEGYSADFDKGNFGLKKLRVETFEGMIFATFNMDAEPLEDFLGNAKPWIRLFMKQGERFHDLAESLRDRYDDAQVRRIVRAVGGCGFNLNLFPNAACSLSFFRILRPVNAEETEIRHMALGLDGGPAEANQMRMRLHEHFQGPMGFGSPDDSEVWERVQRGTKGDPDGTDIMVNRGLGLEKTSENGLPVGDISAETGMRGAYRKWKEMMA